MTVPGVITFVVVFALVILYKFGKCRDVCGRGGCQGSRPRW